MIESLIGRLDPRLRYSSDFYINIVKGKNNHQERVII